MLTIFFWGRFGSVELSRILSRDFRASAATNRVTLPGEEHTLGRVDGFGSRGMSEFGRIAFVSFLVHLVGQESTFALV